MPPARAAGLCREERVLSSRGNAARGCGRVYRRYYMSLRLDDTALDRLFRSARSIHKFKSDPVTDATLQTLYDLLKFGPTAFNAQPARYVFIRSAAGKARLDPALSASNKDKTRAA